MADRARPAVRSALPAVLALLAFGAPAAASDEPFVEVAAEVGLDFVHDNGGRGKLYFPEIAGAGGALVDFDGDGDLDVYLVQGGPLDVPGEPPPSRPSDRLFRNDLETTPDGGRRLRFVDVTEASGVVSDGFGMAVAAADFDNDGRVDLYVANFGPNRLLRNLGGGRFADVTAGSGADDGRWTVAVSALDYDGDGWLDLFLGNYVKYEVAGHKDCYNRAGSIDYCGPQSYEPDGNRLLRNRGDGRFEDVTVPSGIASALGSTLGSAAADYDGDGRIDLYVANDLMPNQLWINRGGGRFEDEALFAGCALSGEGTREAGMGVVAEDLDGDGRLDLLVTHLTHQTNTLYLQRSAGLFEDASTRSGLGTPSWKMTGFGAGALDLELDGDLDVLVVNGSVAIDQDLVAKGDPFPFHQPNQLFRALGGGRFEVVEAAPGSALAVSRSSRGAAFGDVDNDGDTDVLITNNHGPAELLLNRAADGRPWIGARVVGPGGRDALGAQVALARPSGPLLWRRVATDASYASASDPRVLFAVAGGGPATLEVRWPDGERETFGGLEPGRYHTLERGAGGGNSAPPAGGGSGAAGADAAAGSGTGG